MTEVPSPDSFKKNILLWVDSKPELSESMVKNIQQEHDLEVGFMINTKLTI